MSDEARELTQDAGTGMRVIVSGVRTASHLIGHQETRNVGAVVHGGGRLRNDRIIITNELQ